MGVPIRPASDSQIERLDQIDFTGGLNLNPEQFKLAENETPDCMDVDFGRYGGMRQRKAIDIFPTYLYRPGYRAMPIWTDGTDVKAICSFGSSPSLNMVAVDLNANTHSASLLFTGTIAYQARGEMYDSKLWVNLIDPAGTTGFVRTYNGSTLTALSDAVGSFDPDYNTPSGTKYIRHAVSCFQHDRMWVGYTNESSTDYENRVRFSFAGDPGSWLEDDFIDIEVGKNGDEIVAIRALGDHVLVFKRSSIHMIAGYDQDSFQVITLTDGIGAVSQEATAVGLGHCWFFDPDQGLMSIDPSGSIQNHYRQLQPLLDDGTLDASTAAHVGIVLDRVFAFVDGQDYTYVYDPVIQAWTRYDETLTSFSSVNFDGVSYTYAYRLSPDPTLANIAELTRGNDNSTSSATSSYWRSPWMTAGAPADRKRWKRLKLVCGLNAGTSADIRIDAYKDYDDSVVASTVDRTITDEIQIIRGPGMSRSEAVSYKISLASAVGDTYSWSLHSLGARWKRSSSSR